MHSSHDHVYSSALTATVQQRKEQHYMPGASNQPRLAGWYKSQNDLPHFRGDTTIACDGNEAGESHVHAAGRERLESPHSCRLVLAVLAVFLQRAGEDGIRRGHHSHRSASVPKENLGVEPSEREHLVRRHADMRGRDSPVDGGPLRRHIHANSLCTWIITAGRHDIVQLVQVVHTGED